MLFNFDGKKLLNNILCQVVFLRRMTTIATDIPKMQKNNRMVGYWLFGCSGMVVGAVVLGN